MTKPVLLADNVFSEILYPGHTVTASSEASKHEVWRVATGRRSSFDAWSPTGFSATSHVQAIFDRPRLLDMLVMDYGHNLDDATASSREIKVQLTFDAFGSTWEPYHVAPVVPLYAQPAPLNGQNGVLTEEGAWAYRWPATWATGIRILFPNMGASVKPTIVGLWCGQSLEFDGAPTKPLAPDTSRVIGQTFEVPSGARGRGERGQQRGGTLNLRLRSFAEYQRARVHVSPGHFAQGRPMWLAHDKHDGANLVLAELPDGGEIGFGYESGWGYAQLRLDWTEVAPRRLTA